MIFAKIFLINKTYDNTGLGTDAKIFKKTLFDSYIYYINNTNIPESKVNIFLETLPDNFNNLKKTAKKNILMVNQEYLIYNKLKLIKNIDIIFAKSRFAVRILKEYRKHFNLKFKIYYTKFTSIIKTSEQRFMNGNGVKKIAHFAGKSPFKMTDIIFKVWKKNNHYPLINITCFEACYKNLLKYVKLIKLNNLILYKNRLNNDKCYKISQLSECYLCPSMMEGYGHYINEGRGNGSFIITTNGGPMNELIDNSCGILIDAIPKTKSFNGFTFIKYYEIKESALEKAINTYLSFSKNEIKKMRTKSYNKFKQDHYFFKMKMNNFYKKMMNKNKILYE